jgi:hypothetical protein
VGIFLLRDHAPPSSSDFETTLLLLAVVDRA